MIRFVDYLSRFKSVQMQFDTIQTFMNRFNGLENTFLAMDSSSNHLKNPHLDSHPPQNDKKIHFPRFKYTI